VRIAVLAALAIAFLAGCATPRPQASAGGEAPRPTLRVLVLPPENLAQGPLASREVTARLEQMVATVGADVVGGVKLDEYLARYRIRYTGGVDPAAARAAREDLGVDAILATTVLLWGGATAQVALVTRLVSTADTPTVLWMDGYARTGDDSPGIFALSVVNDPQVLQAEAMQRIGRSLEAYLTRGARAGQCSGGGWWRPRIAYRARPDERKVASIAVLPFVNETRRRGAGEVLALEFAWQLANAEGFRVVEPGVVRDELLRRRIVMEDGVSLDQARVVSVALDADLVLAGYVYDLEDGAGAPVSNFSAMVIDRKTGRMVWQSTSHDRGNDSETLFGLRRVTTAPLLTCRMAREVIDGMTGARSLPSR
jgi:TolB-like protein